MVNRRTFLQTASALTLMYGVGLSAAPKKNDRYLILIELNGGNDSLNMVVPYSQTEYYRLRPSLGIRKNNTVQLSEHLGLNGVMSKLDTSWAANDMAILPGVGYANPNRSHFKSIEIWDTASKTQHVSEGGWLAEALQNTELNGRSAHAITVGRNPDPVSGFGIRSLVIRDQKQFIQAASDLNVGDVQPVNNDVINHLKRISTQAEMGANDLNKGLARQRASDLYDMGKEAEGTVFYKNIREAASILAGGVAPPVIKLSLGNFDTHGSQLDRHNKLLEVLANGLAELRAHLIEAGLWDRVMVMTYSEFGRRPSENGSEGTDHGTSASQLIMGGKVKGGIHTQMPLLTDLVQKDLKHSLDFRSVYRTVLEGWLELPVLTRLTEFEPVKLIRS